MQMSFWKEFKEFAVKGNVIDLAVGVIIGGAFNKIVTSLVNDIIMPPIGSILGNVSFPDLFIPLDGNEYASLAEAQAAGAPTFNYGSFINTLLDFLIVSLTVFIVIKQINHLRRMREKPQAPKAPETKVCSECRSDIPIEARRCKYCTSVVMEQPSV